MLDKFKPLRLYTDGSFDGSRAGWGGVLVYPNGHTLEMLGPSSASNPLEAEISAVCECTKHLTSINVLFRERPIVVFTDSFAIVSKTSNTAVTGTLKLKSADFWDRLFMLNLMYRATFRKVSRNSDVYSKRSHELANIGRGLSVNRC